MLAHDVFCNRERPGKDELGSYLPKFWQQIREMDANNAAAGHMLDRMAADMEQTVKDRFFDSCSKNMLSRYEKFLQIYNSCGMGIDERRIQVKMKWNGSGKMTGSRIEAIVKECCGSECDVSFGSSRLKIEMTIGDNLSAYINMIREILQNSTIPAHIEILFKINMDLHLVFSWNNDIQFPELMLNFEFAMNEGLFSESKLTNEMIVEQEEEFDFAVTIRNNLHYFDGSLNWNGSVLMNSYVKKEEL